MTRLARLGRDAGLVLGTGYVLAFFSETVFWSLWRPADDMAGRVLTWLLYSFFGYLTLAVIRCFRIDDGWMLLLAGAFFGWVCEGVYAMTVYGDPSMPFPLTIVWTALAWHAPLSLVVGWYALGLALRAGRPGPAMLLSLLVGGFWGAWALGWRAETPPLTAPPLDFLLHAAVTTSGLALAHLAIAAGHPERYEPSRLGLVLSGGVAAGFFVLVTVPAVPLSLLVLPPLLGLVWLALQRGRARRPDGSLLLRFAAPVRPRNLAALALIPLTGTAVYGAGQSTLPPLASVHPLFATVTSLAGLVLLCLVGARALRGRT